MALHHLLYSIICPRPVQIWVVRANLHPQLVQNQILKPFPKQSVAKYPLPPLQALEVQTQVMQCCSLICIHSKGFLTQPGHE